MQLRGWSVVVSGVAACALVAFGAGSAAAASSANALTGVNWGPGVEAVQPANAAEVGDFVAVESVSCPSPGDCTAVGEYTDTSGKSQGLLLTETAGKWAAGVEPVLPANAGAIAGLPGSFVRFVSCASAGNCTAIGTYVDSSGNEEGLLLTETDGSWAPGVEAVLPANAAAFESLQWSSLSCASAGNCAAVGSYTSSSAPLRFQALLLTETDGTWSAGVDAAPDSPAAWLSSVSCASSGNCTAVGAADDSSNVMQTLQLTETAGSWGPPVAATLPAGNQNLGAELTSVSCGSAGTCTAVGLYDMSNVTPVNQSSEERGKGLLLTETAGSWEPAVEVPLPADAEGPDALNAAQPPVVSCSSAGSCSAVASYFDSSFGLQGLLLSETAGSWAPGVESRVGGFLNAVSCASPGNCGALVGGVLLGETGGSWGSEVETPVPVNGGAGLLYSVSCASAESCTAVGQYGKLAGPQHGLLVGGSPASVMVDVSTGGTGSGSVSSSPAGIDCGSTCSASFEAGTPLTLTATPSAGSRFSGWSGGGCTGTGSCQVDTGISEQTVTANFTAVAALSVAKKGRGSGTVSSIPAGIDCGPTCSASFDAGSSLKLTATPAKGSRFIGWSGAGCKGTRACQVNTAISEQTVTATFTLLPKCVVPKLKGKTLSAAKRALRADNCSLGKIKHATSLRVRKGHVISQKPAPGRQLRHGAKINLVLSKGRR
jgi:hypothetical protein